MFVRLGNPVHDAVLTLSCTQENLTVKKIAEILSLFSKEILAEEIYNLKQSRVIKLSIKNDDIVVRVTKELKDVYFAFGDGIKTSRIFNKDNMKKEVSEFVVKSLNSKIDKFNYEHERLIRNLKYYVEQDDEQE